MVILSHPLAIYLLSISAVTFLMFGIDKFAARLAWRRVSERTLIKLCIAGGSLGGGLAMMLFRHKVSKSSFLKRYYSVVAVQVVLAGLWVFAGRPMPVSSVQMAPGSDTVIRSSKVYRPVYE